MSYTTTLRLAGLRVNSPRAVYGGLASDGIPVTTTWIDAMLPGGEYPIWMQDRDVNGYRALWLNGRFKVGAIVRLIMLEPKHPVPPLGTGREILSSFVMPNLYRVKTVLTSRHLVTLHNAEVEPTTRPATLGTKVHHG